MPSRYVSSSLCDFGFDSCLPNPRSVYGLAQFVPYYLQRREIQGTMAIQVLQQQTDYPLHTCDSNSECRHSTYQFSEESLPKRQWTTDGQAPLMIARNSRRCTGGQRQRVPLQ